ncbi:hypothetical protein [Corynebacterium sp. 22KM0430]|uniref:hypothetical protein n=1 Tax=Corynebacterium sp. 22KM0430 TaxID=2989735 RepID=UPI0029CA1F30|nr:hypothetical protein [Corynebacterium sp. 22KM0430]WPF65248.1 hypothetical protein OLX12_06560 [Corynebacterium sp. 22KM0430]
MTYPSTPHPEDSPGFDKYPQYSQETPEWAQEKSVQGTGKVNLGAAVPWGFKATFSSWYIWILGTLVLGFVAMALYAVLMILPNMELMETNPDAAVDAMNAGWGQYALSLAQLLIMPFILTGMLAQVDKKRVGLGDFFRNVRYFQVLGLSLVQSLLGLIGVVLIVLPLVALVMNTGTNSVFILVITGAALLLSVLVSPFFVLWD